MVIIDARCRPPIPHFLDQLMYRNIERTLSNMGDRGYEPVPSVAQRSVEQLLSELRDAGVSKFVLPTRAPNPLFGGADDADAFRFRDEHRELVVLAAAPSALEGQAALDDIAAMKGRGVAAIVVEPGVFEDPKYLDDPSLSPLYDACMQTGLPLYIMGGGNAGPDLSYANPLALDRVAARFPALQLVAVHAGWPWVSEVCGVAFRRKNVWLLPDLYFPGSPGEQDYLLALRTYLQDRFLFGTAFPFCPHAQIIARYEALGLPSTIFEKVMGLNAARLLGL